MYIYECTATVAAEPTTTNSDWLPNVVRSTNDVNEPAQLINGTTALWYTWYV